MRRANDIGMLNKLQISRRLLFENVEGRATALTGIERLEQRSLIDDTTASDVDEFHPAFTYG